MSANIKYFSEGTVPGKRFGKIHHNFVIDNLIYEGKSDFQDILVFENSIYGRILVLDGIVQLSESDEFIYHEMITHPFFTAHSNPKKVLIIGGGDGGTLRECLKHDIEECIMVDIDKKVIDVCVDYMPFVSNNAFNDKRAKLIIGDGKEAMKKYNNYFDIIIIDCNDPVGPSLELFTKEFYLDIQKALKKGGICSFQVGSFLDLDFLQKIYKTLSEVFKFVSAHKLTMPSYHCGEYCFMGASDDVDLENIDLDFLINRFTSIEKKVEYYSPAVHKASQILPKKMTLK